MLTIYKASAGSGKTFTLAYNYIQMLLGVKAGDTGSYALNSDRYAPGGHRFACRHRGILAITFTNAATEEMKSRIVRELDVLAAGGESPYTAMLIKEYGCTEAELKDCAGLALGEMLYDYGNFNVSTIDSFFQTVLRTFSREVDHQGDYELSLQLTEVLTQSVSLMLDDLNYSQPDNARVLKDFIRSYTFSKLGEGKSYNFFNRSGSLLTKLSSSTASALDEEIYTDNADRVHNYLADPATLDAFDAALAEAIKKIDSWLKIRASEFIAFREKAGIPPDAYNRYINGLLDKAVSDPSSVGTTQAGSSTARLLADPGPDLKPFYVAARLKANMRFGDDLVTLMDYGRRFGEVLVGDVPRKVLYAEIRQNLPLLRFIGVAEVYLRNFMRDNNIVLISDTGDLLRRIISDAEMPFIYERLGMQLRSLLIDEFQDTSHLQWHNLRPLVANSISEGHDSLIIGDEKQAIYRFRNSDSSLLGHHVGEVDFPVGKVMRGSDAADNTNHRSSGGVVRFNNTLFRRMAADLGVDSYGNVVQTVAKDKASEPAYVKLAFIDTDSTERDEVIEDMAQDMLRQHAAGYRWKDILILTRQREEAKAVAEYLMQHHPDIRILSNEALMLNSSPAVRTIISLLKLVEQSYGSRKDEDKASEAPRYASRDDIVMMISRFNYFRSAGLPVEEALETSLSYDADGTDALNRSVLDIRMKNPANIVALIEAIIALKIPEEQRRKEYAYITALQDIAVNHCDSPDPSISAFVAEYERNIDKWAIKASNDIDAVEIMTIHKSKGLERACVHIPFADWKLSVRSPEMWLPFGHLDGFDDSIVPPLLRAPVSGSSIFRNETVSPFAKFLADDDKAVVTDNLNLAYVAFTRAGRELCVHSGVKNVGAWLHKAFDAPDTSDMSCNDKLMPLGEFFDRETDSFTYGEPTAPDGREKKNVLPPIESGEYKVFFRRDAGTLTSIDDVLAVDPEIGGEVENPCVDEIPVFFVSPEMEEAARRGNAMHSILADTRTIDDLPAAVARARGNITAEEKELYLRELTAAVNKAGATAARWFDPVNKVYAERSIFLADTGESFRPDRVVVSPDGRATVIDYKFTSRPSRKHVQQVELYISLLRRLGREDIEGYVWYPLLSKIIKV